MAVHNGRQQTFGEVMPGAANQTLHEPVRGDEDTDLEAMAVSRCYLLVDRAHGATASVREPGPQVFSVPVRRPPEPEMSQDRCPLPARVRMAEVETVGVGSWEAELLGKIAQALLIEVIIARRKTAMLPKNRS